MSAIEALERALDDVESDIREEIETEWQDKFDALRDEQKHALDTLEWLDLPDYSISQYHRNMINGAINHILTFHELPQKGIGVLDELHRARNIVDGSE